jgi:hypothetical protein
MHRNHDHFTLGPNAALSIKVLLCIKHATQHSKHIFLLFTPKISFNFLAHMLPVISKKLPFVFTLLLFNLLNVHHFYYLILSQLKSIFNFSC